MCYIELTPLQAMCFLKQVHKLTIFQRTKSCLSWKQSKTLFYKCSITLMLLFYLSFCCLFVCFQSERAWISYPLTVNRRALHHFSELTTFCGCLSTFADVHSFCYKHPWRVRFGDCQTARPLLAWKLALKKMRIMPVYLIAISMILDLGVGLS